MNAIATCSKVDATEVNASYAWCRQFARQAASNFYFAFYLLPREKRRSMHALYAFLRHADDLGDSAEPLSHRQDALRQLRANLQGALNDEFCDGPMFPALADTVTRYDVPHEYLFDAISGVEMDLDFNGFETFDDLEGYCYRVASVVGLACIHIWGFRNPAALEPARHCGIAFQLTNILRDLKEDAAAGRIYLPREDLERFDYSAYDLQRGVCDHRFAALMRFEIDRAKRHYEEATCLTAHLNSDGRRVLCCMLATYRGLLDQISRRHADVFRRRIQLSVWRKCGIAVQSLVPQPYAWTARRAAGVR